MSKLAIPTDEERYKEQIAEQRMAKGEFFATHPQSPLTDEQRKRFRALKYYAPDLDYLVTLEILTTLSSNGWRRESITRLSNSGNSSTNKTPL